MKKFLLMVFGAMFFLSITTVLAKSEDQEIKAKNIKIHKKQVLTSQERKLLDELEVKGKPVSDGVKVPVVKFTLPASGILDGTLPLEGKRYAIVIGLANYDGIDMDLCVPEAKTVDQFPEDSGNLTAYCQDSDSLHMRDALINEYGYNNVTVLRDGQATLAGVRDVMRNLTVTNQDEVVFFFSGHGVDGNLQAAGNIYDKDNIHEGILLYDYLNGEGEEQALFDDEIAVWANGLNAHRIVFIFDTCLAGGMDDLQGVNRILALSSGELQNSSVYYYGGTQTEFDETPVYQQSEGLFSHYFVKRGMFNYEGKPDGTNLLSKRNPDKYDGHVSIEESFGYAYPSVLFKQTPVLKDFNKALDILLNYPASISL